MKKYLIRSQRDLMIVLALLLLIVFAGCKPAASGDGTDQDSVAVPPDTVAIRTTDAECADLQPGQFCAAGLDFLKLGDSLVWNNNIKPTLPDIVMKDTVFTETSEGVSGTDTTSWFAKILRLPDGMVILDADFNSGELLGRIRIESGRFHHSSGLRVGSTGKELKAFTTDAYVIPFEEYQVMEIIIPYQGSKMIFHVPQEGILKPGKTDYTMADILDDSKIVRIVLM